jgi:hypothetical protein
MWNPRKSGTRRKRGTRANVEPGARCSRAAVAAGVRGRFRSVARLVGECRQDNRSTSVRGGGCRTPRSLRKGRVLPSRASEVGFSRQRRPGARGDRSGAAGSAWRSKRRCLRARCAASAATWARQRCERAPLHRTALRRSDGGTPHAPTRALRPTVATPNVGRLIVFSALPDKSSDGSKTSAHPRRIRSAGAPCVGSLCAGSLCAGSLFAGSRSAGSSRLHRLRFGDPVPSARVLSAPVRETSGVMPHASVRSRGSREEIV